MPKYSVRLYSTWMDEFEVEAPTALDAIHLAQKHAYIVQLPEDAFAPYEAEHGKVRRLIAHEYADSQHPQANELDADGNWLD